MNKHLIFIVAALILLVGGISYYFFSVALAPAPAPATPAAVTGKVREITVTIKKQSWAFERGVIDAEQGEKIVVTVVNEDEYDHGFAVDAFGVQERVPAHQTVKIEFTATQAGDFRFYCSIPCGEGVVDNRKRTHFDMVGTLRVKAM